MGDIFRHEIQINNKFVAPILNKKSNQFSSASELAKWLYQNKHTTQQSGFACIEKVSQGPTITIDSSLSTTSTNPVQNKVITNAINVLADSIPPTIAVDNTLSTTSTNPVQNAVITNALNSKAEIVSQSSNYIQIGNVLIQWGSGAVDSFPKPFSNLPGFAYSVKYNGNTYAPTCNVTNKNVTWYKLRDRVGEWIAIGRA